MTNPIELLAPAGEPESGYAALTYGADAVYLGMNAFSARASAINFSFDDLAAFVGHAHSLEKRRSVYVTMNTLLQQRDIHKALDNLAYLESVGVDAVIVQDIGLARLVREFFPKLAIHGSTQMAIHNKAGVATLKELGISRVIPARELTMPEIVDVATVPDMEVEIFIHGALCYAYSGLCLLSSHLHGPSGNRGQCAYVCREAFKSSGSSENSVFPMSMKDLALPTYLEELEKAGVASLKIEGRKKSPLYVAATTNYYRHVLDGTLNAKQRTDLESDLRTIFSRPQTTLFVPGGNRKNGITQPSVATHMGDRIGEVKELISGRRGEPDRVRFTLEGRSLERHDGVQLYEQSESLLYGFCADPLSVVTRKGHIASVVKAKPGDLVEVELPNRHPDIPDGAHVYCTSSTAVKRTYKWQMPRTDKLIGRHVIDAQLTVAETTIDCILSGAVHGQDFSLPFTKTLETALEEARNPIDSGVQKAFAKLGGTPFILGDLAVDNPTQRFVPMALLNEVRRDAVEQLEQHIRELRGARVEAIERKIEVPPHGKTEAPDWSIKVDRLAHLTAFDANALNAMREIVIDIGNITPDDLASLELPKEKIRLSLPVITRAWDQDDLCGRVDAFLNADFKKWEASNLSALTYLSTRRDELDISADWPLYVLNTAAGDELRALGFTGFLLSPEDDGRNIKQLVERFPEITVPIYQDTPLGFSEACIYAGINGCERKTCAFEEETFITKNGQTLCAINRNCRTVLVGQQPYSLGEFIPELMDAGARRFRADFLWLSYDPAEIVRIWRSLQAGTFTEGHSANFTRGL